MGKNTATELSNISEAIKNEVGSNPTYGQFYSSYLANFYKLYPNSTAPKDSLISDFYDDFIKHNEIIGY